MFYAWLGWSTGLQGIPRDAYQYLRKALELGEETGSERVVGYACGFLAFACATWDSWMKR